MSSFSGYLEPEEVRRIINAIPLVSSYPERDSLLVELLWQSGCRVTEALTLQPEKVGYSSVNLINLKQRGDKTLLKDVEISIELCQRIRDFCDDNDIKQGDFVFKHNKKKEGHLDRQYVWMITTKASEYARVYKFGKRHPKTGGRNKGAFPHIFRHSNAMRLLEETSDISLVQQQLGHADIKTTQIYAYTKKPKIKKTIAAIKW